MNYFWIRIFDYCSERDCRDKGILLEEFYLKGEELSKENVKEQIRKKYNTDTTVIKFAKPRKNNGLYAIVMDSDKFFYDHFYCEIDTYCFYCHKEIKGKASNFPNASLKENCFDTDLEDKDTIFFCDYDCQHDFFRNLRYEGEFQEKEPGENGDIFGYIYLIYNRVENKYYVGQTRYMPFFRWQEHIKNGGKGNITDMTFSVITEVKRNRILNEFQNQEYLNNIEAWWISKYKEEGKSVFNVTIPKLTLVDYKKRFEDMIAKEKQLKLDIDIDINEITIGSHIKTTKEYKQKLYEPLLLEEILDGIVLSIDKNDVVTYELLKSSCNFNKPFNNHMDKWKKGKIKKIGLKWLESIK